MRRSGKSRRTIFTGLLLLLSPFLILSVSSGDTSSTNPPSATERRERVQRYVLENGLTVILEENHFAPVVAMSVWVKVGSADEAPEEEGLAHVHEHMLFKGTERRGVGGIANEVEAAGGDINAYTSLAETVYYLTIPSRHLKLGLDVLADAMFHSSFDSKELRKELEVVLEEIKRGDDNPSVKLSHALFDTAYKTHPYRKPIIGTDASVSRFKRSDVVEFYRRWYAPDNMVLVVVGDFNEPDTREIIEGSFGAERSPNRKKIPLGSRAYPQEPPQESPRVKILRGELQEGYLDIAFHIPAVKGEDVPALEVLAYILGNGDASRLYRVVQSEKGLVHSIYAYTFTPRDPGLFFVSATLDAKQFAPALEAVLDEVARFKTALPSTDELSRAKTNIESETIYSRETVQGESRRLGFYEAVVGDLGFEEKYLSKVRLTTVEDVQQVALKYLNANNITVAAYIPKQLKVESADEQSVSKMAAKALSVKPAPLAEAQVTRVVLPNGVTLIIKESHSVPVVAMRSASLGGLRFESPKERGVSNFIARTLTKGTAKRSADQIADQAERIAGSLGGYSGRDSIGLASEFLSDHFDEGLDLFSDVLLNPTFTPKEVEQQRREILAAIRHIEDSPEQLILDLFKRNLYPKHPYGSRTLGEISTIEGIKRQDMMSYYRGLLAPNNLVIAVVGDVRVNEVVPKIQKALANLKDSGKFEPPRVPQEKPLEKIRRAEIVRDKEQAQIIVGFRGASLKDEDRYALDVLAAILSGQGGRLFVELRDRQHLAYSIGAAAIEALEPGFFYFYMGTRPENREKALAGILAEIKRIRSERVSDEELSRAREYIAGSYDIGLQTTSAQASTMALNELYGLGWKEMTVYPKKIRGVTASQVLDVAKRYLDPNRYVLAVLIPSGTSHAPSDTDEAPRSVD